MGQPPRTTALPMCHQPLDCQQTHQMALQELLLNHQMESPMLSINQWVKNVVTKQCYCQMAPLTRCSSALNLTANIHQTSQYWRMKYCKLCRQHLLKMKMHRKARTKRSSIQRTLARNMTQKVWPPFSVMSPTQRWLIMNQPISCNQTSPVTPMMM